MRSRRLVLVLGLLLGHPLAPVDGQAGAPATPAEEAAAIATALARVAPSLVRIHVVAISHQDGREIKREASGSGTIITPEGHVVTNHHVAGRTRSIVCTLATREEIPAELVGTDPLSDIAVLRLRPPAPRTFPAATFGDVSALRVGDRVLALGSPLALSQSVTMGIVSNVEMILPRMFWPFNQMTLEGEDVGSLVRWIGHDAPIFGGNSGGPLVNMQGEIVGVNEISLGLAGAIPADLVREVAEAIIRDGRVRRSWIGLEIQPLLKSSTHERGALVGGVFAGSPAERAGFKAGDVLLDLAGKAVTVRFAEEVPLFNQRTMRLPIGTPVKARVLRAGVEIVLGVTPVERESAEAPPGELPALGITASDLTAWSARELRRSTDGVLVRGVRPGGPASEAKPELRDNDVIVSFDGSVVSSLEGLEQALERVVPAGTGRTPVLLGLDRAGARLLTVVEIGRAGLEDPGLEARKAWVPVDVQVLTRELAARLKVPGQGGVRVTRVFDYPSEGSALKVGDIITAIDGERIEATQPSDAELFAAMIRQYRIGTRVELGIIREGQPMTIPITLEASPRLPREMKKYEDPNFEFRVRDIAAADRLEAGMPAGQAGVRVDAVREGGWAALGQLAEGDLLLAIDGEPAADVEAVHSVMARIAKTRPTAVVFHVRRGIRTFFVELQTGWQ